MRINERGEVIVLVAVPIQRFRTVRGALLLSTQGAEIDETVAAERLSILKVFLIAAGVQVLLSVLLAGTIAGPGPPSRRRRRPGAAAPQGPRRRFPISPRRRDEIGHLSGNLREMTDALYNRIEAIESFAADVAHELKNPLTSLRSAVETLPLAKTDVSRTRLLSVIQDDVKRLDRLISDISDASRLDAELQRQEAAPVDLQRLLSAVVTIASEVKRENDVSVALSFEGSPRSYTVPGHDSRLGQVVEQPDRQCALVFAAGRNGAGRLPPHGDDIADHRRRRRPRHSPGSDREDLRALLHRPAAAELRPEFGARPVDLQADR